MEYKDTIISHFKDKELVDNAALKNLIETQKVRVLNDNNLEDSNDSDTLEKCTKALSIYTDMIKLKFLLKKSWELQTLNKSVMLKFHLHDISVGSIELAGKNQNSDFYKDISLKTIAKCDKLSRALEQLTSDNEEILNFLNSNTDENISCLLNDSMCLLLEIWFLCGHILRDLKRQVAGLFIRGKLMLIDHELELIGSELSISDTNYQALHETISSYKSFIKVLLQQLIDSEQSHDQTLFEECLGVFLDVEAMYQALNFNWLLRESKTLQTLSDIVDNTQEIEEIEEISEFVDSSILENESHDDITPLNNGVSSTNTRRLSSSSNTSDISLMMEKTSLSKELPHLLQAFNNAKKLEQELENAKLSPSTTPTTPHIGLFSILNNYTSTSKGLTSPTEHHSNVHTSNQVNLSCISPKPPNLKISETLIQNNTEFAKLKSLIPPLINSEKNEFIAREDMLKSFPYQGNSNFPTTKQVHGFGSNILNNLYGLGSKK